jgi:hypothetical protein
LVSSQLPVWLQYVQAFATIVIALLALVIAFGQWRTAHQRVVLDLFERRMEVYDAITRVTNEILQRGDTPQEMIDEFARATARVDLLFKPEVKTYLDYIYQALLNLHVAEAKVKQSKDASLAAALNARDAAVKPITAFSCDFSKLVKPYLKMQHKAFWF